jgi:predicted MPP superfamily phosphohydrolase
MRRFWIALYTLTAVAHAPFAVGLARVLSRASVPLPALFAALLSTAAALQIRGRVENARMDGPIARWKLYLVEEPFYVHWCATLVSAPLFALGALAITARHLLGAAGSFTAALGDLAVFTYLAALALSFYGVVVRRRWLRVRTIEISVPRLGAEFEGYRIAQLSDLHIGGLGPRRRTARWVSRANALDVDLVALTGDYVTSGTAFHHDIAAVLTELRARDGVFAVMGNHDYFGEGEPMISLLRAGGVTVLRNEHRTITRGDDRLIVAGVDDTYTRRADIPRAFEGREEGLPLVALAHDPQLFHELARRGAALVLSGHTHWGQLALPFVAERVNLSRLSYRYHAGLYYSGASTLYVNPGLGTTGPPVRLGAPPEITVLRLRCAEAPKVAVGLPPVS